MKNALLSLFILLFGIQSFTASAQTQFEQDGVVVPRTISFENKTLELNGYGTRSKMFVDVYVQALYLSRLSQDPKDILESDSEMAIRIQITSSLVSSRKLTRNMEIGFEKSAGDNINELRPRIEELKKYLSDEIVEKDVFNLIYNPTDTSVHIFKNDKFKGKIQGTDFKKALFGIWLSDKPVDDKLKNELLGKAN
ncbi:MULTISPECIES: chalcone isomerase family protein [Flavobacterium]|uniref:Chalcone isomerase family protein n=1 Tax=Flavobacterium hankyongi TaxID=1176532 RepID=A0ABP8ZWF9_9FLAO|nr:chalcone isomerase family protein [Flavobacterium sp. N1846]